MSKPVSVEDLIHPSHEPPEPGYEEWVVERIKRAVAEADANPDDFYTAEEVRAYFEKKFRKNAR